MVCVWSLRLDSGFGNALRLLGRSPFPPTATPPSPGERGAERAGNLASRSLASWHRSGQWVRLETRSGPGLAKLAATSPVFHPSPTFAQMWKGQPFSGNGQTVLIWDLKVISRIQPCFPTLLPCWFRLHPRLPGHHGSLPPPNHPALIPAPCSLLPTHSQRESVNP